MLKSRWFFVALSLGIFLGATDRCRADVTYLALGDSVTFGIDPSTPAAGVPSYGDQGFVGPFATGLSAFNNSIRPTVLNLGISGEQSTSFFSAVTTPTNYGRAWQLNLNYTDATTSQNALMLSDISAIHAKGNSVGYVTFLIGSNDIFALVQSAAFQGASAADQQKMIASTIGTVQSNYVTVLSELKQYAPEAQIVLPDYYNPYPSSVPQHAFYDSILAYFNPVVHADANAFGARFVDIYPIFTGNELQLTNIATGDVHPNQAGYAKIAGVLVQSVPEPSPMMLSAMGVAILGLARFGWNRRGLRVA